MENNEFYVSLEKVSEANWTEWITADTNIPGLCLADTSLEELIETCKVVIPELINDNTPLHGEIKVDFRIPEDIFVSEMAA